MVEINNYTLSRVVPGFQHHFRRGLFSRSYTGSRLAAGACLLPGVCWRAWLLPVTGPTTISTVHDFGLTCMGSGG